MDTNNIKYHNLGHMLEVNSNVADKGITFITSETEETRITYKELYDEALDILNFLQSRGIKQGTEMIFQIADNRKLLPVFWACLIGGIIPVPVSIAVNEEQALRLLRIWKILDNPYLVIQSKILEALKNSGALNALGSGSDIVSRIIPVEMIQPTGSKGVTYDAAWDDTAFIQFSSGSTGDPKGVLLSHGNLLTNMNAIIKCSGAAIEDSSLSWMPLSHDMGMIGFHMTPLMRNIEQYLIPPQLFLQRPMLWIEKLNQFKATLTSSPNFGYKHFLSFFNPKEAEHWDLSSVKLIFNGAEPISADLSNEFYSAMKPYKLKETAAFPVYGMAEASLAVSFPPPTEELVTITLDREYISVGQEIREVDSSTGKGITFVDLGYCVDDCLCRICDESDKVLGDNSVGYIQIKGDNVTKGFYKNEEATKKVFTADGWLNTGDLGFMRNGRLVVSGRAKDIIFVNGQNFYPHDIERVCEEVKGINFREVAACGVFDQTTQKEELVLFVINKRTLEEFALTAVELKKHASKKLNLTVKEVVPVSDIPKTHSNKLERYKLGDLYKKGEFSCITAQLEEIIANIQDKEVETDAPKTEVEATLLGICKEILEIDELGVNDNFNEMGADSIKLAQVQASLDELFPGKINITDLFTYPTISKLAEYLEGEASIQIKAISLPAEYMNTDGEAGDAADFEFSLRGTGFEKIRTTSKAEEIEIIDLLSAVFIYLFEEITGNSAITTQQMLTDTNLVSQLDIDFSKIENFTEFFKLVRDNRINPVNVYTINSLSKVRVIRGENSIVPFIYRKRLLSSDKSLLNIYDIILEVTESEDGINFVLQYNGRLLKKAKVKVIIDSYIKLIEMLS